jgi:predicted small metal-binding protein
LIAALFHLQTKNMKILHCSDAGFPCDAVVRAHTDKEVLQHAADHAKAVHHVAITPEMVEQIRQLIREEKPVSEEESC